MDKKELQILARIARERDDVYELLTRSRKSLEQANQTISRLEAKLAELDPWSETRVVSFHDSANVLRAKLE